MQRSELLAEESGVDTYRKPQSDWKKIARIAVGASILVAVGFVGGKHGPIKAASSIEGTQNKAVIRSVGQFKTAFDSWAAGVTCPNLATAVYQIAAAAATNPPAPANGEVEAFRTWREGLKTATQTAEVAEVDSWMNTKLQTACSPAPASSVAPAVTVPKTSEPASEYTEFGAMYSSETAGKPWSEILLIDASVRAPVVPLTASAVVHKLNAWYSKHLTDDQRKNFDESAVANMKSHGMQR